MHCSRTVAALLSLLLSLAAVGCRSSAEPEPDASLDPGTDGSESLGDQTLRVDSPPAVCDPVAPRAAIPQLLVGPKGLEGALLAVINGAKKKLQIMMYQLTLTSFIDAIIAAKARGVAVQVLLDGKQDVNSSARSKLQAAGVPVRPAPAEFDYAHSKVIIVDTSAVVMSANLIAYSMSSERNYGVIDRDAADLASLVKIFERDWAGSGVLDLSCTRLVVSPINSRQRLLAFINGASKSLGLAVMSLTDSEARNAVIGRAKAGVSVRVLLADPAWIASNTQTAASLGAEGIPVRYLKTYDLHAKLIVVDGAAFVGSENLTYGSLQRNREVGMLVTEPQPAGGIAAQFEADWQAGTQP